MNIDVTKLDVTRTKILCPSSGAHTAGKNIWLLERVDGTLFCAAHGDIWVNQHSADCEVTKQRAALLSEMTEKPNDPYLLGAFAEYDRGGDQEGELCDCGFVR